MPATQTPELRTLLARLPQLSEELVAALGQVAGTVDSADGTLVMEEGERTDELYTILAGKLTAFRPARGTEAERRLVTLEVGELVGEMALIDGSPRSLSIRADGDCRLLRISPEDLARLPEGQHLLTEFKAALGAAVVQRMRSLTDRHVAALERELAAIRDRQQFGQFFLYTMTVMAIGMVTNNLISTHFFSINPYSVEFAWIFALVLIVPSVVIVRMMRIPFSDLGLRREGLRESMKEGTLISAATLLLSVALVKTGLVPGPKGPIVDPVLWAAYFTHSALQELFARGFFQTAFQRFLDDRRGIRSVVISSILFGIFHIHFGLGAVAATAVGGLLFGAFYLRHKNLAGVTLVHFIVGACFFSLGLV